MWGTTLRWETRDVATHRFLEQQVLLLLDELSLALDPDCIWRDATDGCTNPAAKRTATFESLAKQLSAETLGFFDIRRVMGDGTTKRDFSGLAKGFVLDELAHARSDGWMGVFGTDVYMAQGVDLLDDSLGVEMNGGWIMGSSSRHAGATAWNPHSPDEPWDETFEYVVLFAQPEFDGARLDAWSTALIPGGEALLDHLWSLQAYRDQWGWFVFERGIPRCSPNLDCELDAEKPVVRTPW